jgi:hypothetical protein
MPRGLPRFARDLYPVWRFARGYRRFAREHVDSASALARVRERLARREERFLQLARERVFGYARSPYLPLLRSAGCGFADLQSMVESQGIEETLRTLAAEGVRVSIDEFKARTPIRRGALSLDVEEEDFDNPFQSHALEAASGGTRSAGTRVLVELDFIAALADDTALAFDAHDLWMCTQCVWLPVGGTASIVVNLYAKLGRPVARWWTHVMPDVLGPRRRRWERFVTGWSRLAGAGLPMPQHAPLSEAPTVARWLAEETGRGGRPCVTTYASTAVRVCRAAREAVLDLAGAVFVAIGEPLTPAKRRAIESVGAKVVVRYAVTEAGILGYGCAESADCDDVHVLSDNLAVIAAPRLVGREQVPVSGLLVTSLLPQSPRILINVETGDYAELTRRDCRCALGRAGLSTHLSRIRSFEKLTGEGMTFVGTRVLRVLEDVLPASFGGQPSDYQLVEVEDAGGITHLELRVDPALGPLDEARVRAAFLAGLEDDRRVRPMADIWTQADIVRIRRAAPLPTSMGKILPFHLVKLQQGERSAT